MRRLALLLGLLLATAASDPVKAAQSIVGRWGVTPAECDTTAAFGVSPQAISTDDMGCDLPGVSRIGDVVTFKGRCTNAGERSAKETVVATLRPDGKLDLAFLTGGGRYKGLVRCRGR